MNGTQVPARGTGSITVLARQRPDDPASPTILEALMCDRGYANLRDQSTCLGISAATLSRAYRGAPVGHVFTRALRTAFPRLGDRHFIVDVPAPAEAA